MEQLNFSDLNTHLLLNYAEKAFALAKGKDSQYLNWAFLTRILQIKDQQIRPLLEQDLVAKEKRQRFFDSKTDLKNNLAQLFR